MLELNNVQGAQINHSRYQSAGVELSSQGPQMAGPMGPALRHMQTNQLNTSAMPVDSGSASNPLVQLTNALVSIVQTLVQLMTSMLGGGSSAAGTGAESGPATGAEAAPGTPAGVQAPITPAEQDAGCACPGETNLSGSSKGGFGDMLGGIMEKLGGLFGGLFGGGKSDSESGGGFMDKLGGIFGGILGGGKGGSGAGGIIEKGLSLVKGFF